MRQREFDTAAAPKAQPASAVRILVAETATPGLASHGLLPHVDLAAGTPPAQPLTAVALRLPGRGHLARVGPVLFQLQHLYGNRSVQRVIGDARRAAHPPDPSVIQPKLMLGPGHDKYEREADRVAQRAADHAIPSGTATPGGTRPQWPAIQRLDNPGSGDVDPDVQHAITRVRRGGQAIPDSVRTPLEWALGADFSDVRLHTDARADELNRALRARAFTTGQDIFLRRGEFSLASRSGHRLLAHELTHVLQQGGGRQMPAVGGLVMVQCSLRDPLGSKVTWADLSKVSSVASKAHAVRKVIEWWADAPSSPKVTFMSYTDLTTQAEDCAMAPSTDFINWLDSVGLEALRTYFVRKKREFSPQQSADIKNRRQKLAQAAVAVFGPNPHLHVPTHDPHYQTPAGLSTTDLPRTGRAGGEWKRVKNTVPGLGGVTTGSVNLALAQEQIGQGNWEQVGDIHVQICPGCGRGQHVESFEVDHQQALSEIRDRLWQLADAMSVDETFHNSIQSATPGFTDYFQVVPVQGKAQSEVRPTEAALSNLSNDLDNLMRLCRICNGATGKRDVNFLEWFEANPFFGPDFVTENLSTVSGGEILARTKHDTGWGKAARDWFYTRHLPILKDNFVLSRLSELVRGNLAKQSQSTMRAHFEPEFVKKRKYVKKASELSLLNEAFVGTSGVIADYLEEGPSPFAPGSPQRFTEDINDIVREREKRKRREKLEATDPFDAGWVAGREGFRYDDGEYHNQRDVRLYEAGYAKGQREATGEYLRGYDEALADPEDPDFLWAPSSASARGFSKVSEYRRHTFRMGFQAGKAGRVPDPTVIPQGIRGEAILLREYMIGYGKGMADR